MTKNFEYCQGCGVRLQTADPLKQGYTPKAESQLCQRCYRLTHYGDLAASSAEIKTEALLAKLAAMDALFLWVIDLFHLEESMVDGLTRHLPNKDIIIVATKRDLLPDTVSQHKITSMIQRLCKEAQLKPKGVVVVGDYGKDGVDEVIKAIDIFRNNRDVVIFGVANAGKSTLINASFSNRLPVTVSQFPGTTVDLIPIAQLGYTIYDTPGIEMRNHLLHVLDPAQVKLLQPKTSVKPVVYQLSGRQSLIIGQSAMIHIDAPKSPVSAVCYFPLKVDVHRTKTEQTANYWQRHTAGKIPSIVGHEDKIVRKTWKKTEDKVDVVLMYVGFISISGDCTITTETIEPCDIIIRKAVI